MLRNAITGMTLRNSHALVVDEIGRSIVNGTYPSGSLLPGDTEFAGRFDVSRTVLREAMKTLGAKGLIIAKARIGTRVTERASWNFFDSDVLRWHLDIGFDETFLRHLTEMRLSFEPYAARLAAERATTQEIERMYECIEAMENANSMEAFAYADLELHLAVIEAAGNPFMYSVGNLIEAAMATSFRLSSPHGDPARQQAIALKHRRVVDGIQARDGNAAADAVSAVIAEGRDRLLEAGFSKRKQG